MDPLIQRRELHADGAQIAVATLEFFPETNRRRIDRGKEQEPVRRAPDVGGDCVVWNIPAGRLRL